MWMARRAHPNICAFGNSVAGSSASSVIRRTHRIHAFHHNLAGFISSLPVAGSLRRPLRVCEPQRQQSIGEQFQQLSNSLSLALLSSQSHTRSFNTTRSLAILVSIPAPSIFRSPNLRHIHPALLTLASPDLLGRTRLSLDAIR